MNDCDRMGPLVGARPGEISGAEAAELARHLEVCEACRGFAADVAAMEGLVADGLSRAAARRDLAAFADGVMERIPAAAWKGRRHGEAHPRGLLAWARHHRILAGVTALVPALAAVAIYLYISGAGGAEPGVVVSSETLAPVLLETSDGPVILVGDAGDET